MSKIRAMFFYGRGRAKYAFGVVAGLAEYRCTMGEVSLQQFKTPAATLELCARRFSLGGES